MNHREFYNLYFKYVAENTEAAFVYHRWSMTTVLAAHLGADVKVMMGHFNITPHFYIQLLGLSGYRKSSAISIPIKLAKELDCVNLAPDQISREALIGLLGELSDTSMDDDEFEAIFNGESLGEDMYTNLLIPADEFNGFIGQDKDSYMLLLSQLWDGKDDYDKRLMDIKTSINKPYINLLSGNTFTGFSDTFDGRALGMGMLTRMIVVPWHKVRHKVPFPEAPNPELKAKILETMKSMYKLKGIVTMDKEARDLLARIYTEWKMATPESMEQYKHRRFTHLLKLCTIFSSVDGSMRVTKEIVLDANTMLAANEQNMANVFTFVFQPQEVGIAMNMAYEYLKTHRAGASMGELMGHTANVCKAQSLVIALNKLVNLNKIKYTDAQMYLFNRDYLDASMGEFLNLSFLTAEERKNFNIGH